MEKREFTYPSKDGKTQIHAIEWIPEQEVKAVLQICHGMVEYIDRYHEFASYLAERGIYVTGHIVDDNPVAQIRGYSFKEKELIIK